VAGIWDNTDSVLFKEWLRTVQQTSLLHNHRRRRLLSAQSPVKKHFVKWRMAKPEKINTVCRQCGIHTESNWVALSAQ
jgi:hypothetical protein